MSPADAIGLAGAILFLLRLLPQPVRLWRRGVPDGVSPQSALNMLVSDLGWMVYGLAVGLVPIWVVTLCALPIDVFLLVLLRRQVTARQLLLATAWAGVCAGAWAIGGITGLGLALAAAVCVNHLPQVRAALASDELAGIAPTTWLLALADGLLWGTYGLAVGDLPVVLYGVVIISSALVILTRLHRTDHPIWSGLRVGSDALT
jgi:uncharacterized protein with PQ loop repeat